MTPFTLLVILSSNAFAADEAPDPVPVAESRGSFASRLEAAAQQTDSLLELDCLSGSARRELETLKEKLAGTRQGVSREYDSYMGMVASPMEGNGRCEGGFQSVVDESVRRAERSRAGRAKIAQVQKDFDESAMNHFFRPAINLGGNDVDCLTKADELIGGIEKSAVRVHEGLDALQLSFSFEENRFRRFQATNEALRLRCGETSASGKALVKGAAGPGSAASGVPSGKSRNPASTITGVEEDRNKQGR